MLNLCCLLTLALLPGGAAAVIYLAALEDTRRMWVGHPPRGWSRRARRAPQ